MLRHVMVSRADQDPLADSTPHAPESTHPADAITWRRFFFAFFFTLMDLMVDGCALAGGVCCRGAVPAAAASAFAWCAL